MPANMSVLQNLRPVQVPDPTVRPRLLMEAQAMQQNARKGELQIQGAEQEQAAQQEAQQKALAVHEVLKKYGGDFEKAIPEIMQIDPAFGTAMAKTSLDMRNTESQIAERKSQADERKAKANAPIEVSPGASLFDRIQNKSIFTAPKPQEPITLSPGSGLLKPGEETPGYTQPFAPKAEPVPIPGRDVPLPPEVEAQRVRMRPPQQGSLPVVIQTGEGPQLVDRASGTVRPITRDGQQVPQAPTAEMRNKEAARTNATQAVLAIEELSKKLINKVGIAQRATAAGRSIEAALGNDPEYRTYQDSRFALAGNLAVLQQGSRVSDADVKALWLPMVPDMFRDTKESAAMKWTLIKQMSGLSSQSPSAGGSLDDEIMREIGK